MDHILFAGNSNVGMAALSDQTSMYFTSRYLGLKAWRARAQCSVCGEVFFFFLGNPSYCTRCQCLLVSSPRTSPTRSHIQIITFINFMSEKVLWNSLSLVTICGNYLQNIDCLCDPFAQREAVVPCSLAAMDGAVLVARWLCLWKTIVWWAELRAKVGR